MWDQVGRLYAYHGDVPAEVRLLKLTEEVGEVADAFIGMHGLNGRKGNRGSSSTSAGTCARAHGGGWKRLGGQYRSDAVRVIGQAQDQMSADPDGSQSGRFGFDGSELHLHIAEASLLLGDPGSAREHAQASRAETRAGRPSWAAATLTLAQAEAAHNRASDAAALAHAVLDAIPADALRQTSRTRLRNLDRDLAHTGSAAAEARSLAERVRALPQLMPVGRISGEPNGH